MLVTIDTNVIIPDYGLKRDNSRILLSAVKENGHDLCVSEVVIEELSAKAKGAMVEFDRDVGRAVGKAKANFPPEWIEHYRTPEDGFADEIVQHYQAWVLARLQQSEVFIIPYPQVQHQSIVKRLSEQRPPFLDKIGHEGYRDTLIWLSVIQLARDFVSDVVFISNDKAFGSNHRLRDELRAELRDNGIPLGRFLFFSSLDAFAASVLASNDTREFMLNALGNSTIEGHPFLDYICSAIMENQAKLLQNVFPFDGDPLYLARVVEVQNASADWVIRLPSNQLMARIYVYAVAEIGLKLHSPYPGREQLTMFPEEVRQHQLFDGQDSLATTPVRFDCSVITDSEFAQIVSIEVVVASSSREGE